MYHGAVPLSNGKLHKYGSVRRLGSVCGFFYLFFPGIRKAVEEKAAEITGYVVDANGLKPFTVTLGELTDEERQIILKGCLINYNRVEK